MYISDTVVLHESLDAERRRPVRKDPVESGVEGLRATLAVSLSRARAALKGHCNAV